MKVAFGGAVLLWMGLCASGGGSDDWKGAYVRADHCADGVKQVVVHLNYYFDNRATPVSVKILKSFDVSPLQGESQDGALFCAWTGELPAGGDVLFEKLHLSNLMVKGIPALLRVSRQKNAMDGPGGFRLYVEPPPGG